jgi:hypothetical protein
VPTLRKKTEHSLSLRANTKTGNGKCLVEALSRIYEAGLKKTTRTPAKIIGNLT